MKAQSMQVDRYWTAAFSFSSMETMYLRNSVRLKVVTPAQILEV
jgi:hypothetical protein